MSVETWQELSQRERDILIGRELLGYWVYHYDKDHPDSCYYQLVDQSFTPVVVTPHYATGQRKTEAVAWDDMPPFTMSRDAVEQIEEEIERRGLRWQYLSKLVNLVAPFITYDRFAEWGEPSLTALWDFLNATPDQRCRAALLACGVFID